MKKPLNFILIGLVLNLCPFILKSQNPDLVIYSFQVESTDIIYDELTPVDIYIKNIGRSKSLPFKVRLMAYQQDSLCHEFMFYNNSLAYA